MPLSQRLGLLLWAFMFFTTIAQAGHIHRHLLSRQLDATNVNSNAQQLASDLDRVKSSFNAFSSDFWNYINNLGSRMSAIEQYLGIGSSPSSTATAVATASISGPVSTAVIPTSSLPSATGSAHFPTTSASGSVPVPTAPGIVTSRSGSPTSASSSPTTSAVLTQSSAPQLTTLLASTTPVRAGVTVTSSPTASGSWTAIFPGMSPGDISSLLSSSPLAAQSSAAASSSPLLAASSSTRRTTTSSSPASPSTTSSRPQTTTFTQSTSSRQISTTLSASASTATQFDPLSNQNLAVYYGQTPNTTAQGLSPLCADPRINIVILAFVPTFFAPQNAGYPSVEFGPACYSDPSRPATPGLLNCAALAPQIAQCQAAGKKVLVSLGGYIAQSSFASDAQATQFASTLWDLFGASGNASARALRPFGPDVVLDGFDVDNEDHSTAHWGVFAGALRALYARDSTKQYYLSAAPQCPRPDASIPSALYRQADFVWVQFYNNPSCDLDAGTGFLESAAAWAQDLEAGSGTTTGKPPRFFVGMGAWPGAGQGYVDGSQLKPLIAKAKGLAPQNFGGVMLWDGTVGEGNGYVGAAKDATKQ